MSTARTTPAIVHPLPGRGRNLWLATLAFAITFWAWNEIGPLGIRYAQDLELTPTQTSILVAVPVLVGSLGRIVTGVLTDRYGGRSMFTLFIAISAVPLILVMWAGSIGSYVMLLIFGFLLGIAGTTFAIGVPFVNAWYDASKRGFATGVFGMGMGGTALSAFFTPRMVQWFGYATTHIVMAVTLLVLAGVVWVFMRDSPAWRPNTDKVLPKLAAAGRLAITWQMSFLYAVAFGGFVAFSTYLPTYLNTVYGYELADAGTRTAGFAVAAVVARPFGGILSDRFGPARVLMFVLSGTAVMAVVIALVPPPELLAGASFVIMGVLLAAGAGAVFAWVAQRAPQARVGTITGMVGAAGGLGGFFPPLLMGATYSPETGGYAIGLGLLCATAVAAVFFTYIVSHAPKDEG